MQGPAIRFSPRSPLAFTTSGSHTKTKKLCIWTAPKRGSRLSKSPDGHRSSLEKGNLGTSPHTYFTTKKGTWPDACYHV
jgi:hypothetical protein